MTELEIATIEHQYPLAGLVGQDFKYMANDGGVILLHRWDEKRSCWRPVSTPWGVTANLCYVDLGEIFGLRVVVQSENGERRSFDFMCGDLARPSSIARIKARMRELGVRFYDRGDTFAIQALKGINPGHGIRVLSHQGGALDRDRPGAAVAKLSPEPRSMK